MNGRAMSADALQASTRVCSDLDREAGLDEGEHPLERGALARQHHPVLSVEEPVHTHGVSVFLPRPSIVPGAGLGR